MRRGFHDLIAQQFSTIFSAGCYFSDNTKLNHISAIPTTPTKSTFVQWNQASPFHFHLFPSFRNSIGQGWAIIFCSGATLRRPHLAEGRTFL